VVDALEAIKMKAIMTAFYADKKTIRIYEERVTVYNELLRPLYPSLYNWDLHANMVREMVRREMELEIYDRLINVSLDTPYTLKKRKEASDMLRGYRNDLGISLPQMKRLKAITGETGTKSIEAGMEKIMAAFA